MSILCYVTFNDGGSVLKSVFGEWGPMFSPESPGLARSAASQWGPQPPVRAQQQRTTPRTQPPPPSPPLAPQISSSRLNRLFYFISLSSGEQHRPTPSVSFSLSPFLSASGAQNHGPHPPERTEQSQSTSIMFLVKFFMKRLQFDSEYIL